MMSICFRKNRILPILACLALAFSFTGCKKKELPVFSGTTAIEAEDCLVSHSGISKNYAFGGGKAVSGIDNEKSEVSFRYDASQSGYYDLTIDYSNDGEAVLLGLFVNGHFFKQVEYPQGKGTVTETIFLDKGLNPVSFRYLPGDGSPILDRFTITSSSKHISMVVVPHEDDEILAFAGSIQQILKRGDIVKVVLLTNGDFFDIDLCTVRLRESTRALELLGVDKTDIYVMGYGDLVVESLYLAENPEDIFLGYNNMTSTRADPEMNMYEYHLLDTGEVGKYSRDHFLGDLTNVIRTCRPDVVFTTSEFEWHPDHASTFRFVRDILASLSTSCDYHPVLCESVVHGEEEEWPEELEFREDGTPIYKEFSNPFPTMETTLSWDEVTKITLTDEELALKYQAIGEFDSQNNGGKNYDGNSKFNYAFCKRDEFYWTFQY